MVEHGDSALVVNSCFELEEIKDEENIVKSVE